MCFNVCKIQTDSPGDVTLLHYLGWPDRGVPPNAISMINSIRRVRKSHSYSNTDLMVVHCSAGVGRAAYLSLCTICWRESKLTSPLIHSNLSVN